ncbi:hypothetical protein F4815DRAFT_445810 [Daldinia loculata]|nr:hypothetical protein F4815DRAFT_445810 [Daldinia loculata]
MSVLLIPDSPQGSINKQISRYETTAVYTHPDAKVDIVLVHGLNGDPQKTWTAKNDVFWPTDLLPTSLRDARANILVYGYNADVYSKKHGSNPSDNFIYMHAQTLVTSLTHYRKDEQTSHNPIIWVCHSLGGILVKRALLYSNDLRSSQHEDYRSIYVATYGLVFLGTPHTGSDLAAWGTMLQAMSDAVVPRTFFQSESVLLRTLKRDNETLQNINIHFLDIYQRFKILMAHENHKSDLKGTRMLIVDAHSASPQLPGVTYFSIEATHSGMCKFESRNAPGYRTIATALRDWVADAPDVITTRWRVEEDEKLARAKHEIEERMKPWLDSQRFQQAGQGSIPQQLNETLPSTPDPSKIDHHPRPLITGPVTPNQPSEEDYFPSQQSKSDDNPPQEPLFVKPTVFRPNTYFKGRAKELRLLHKMLMDRKRRSLGTSSVLIQSMPGGGKTHLARQYVFQHRYDYPGGIFWIRAKSLEELDYGFWDIAKTVGLNEMRLLDRSGLIDTHKMVKAVHTWLSVNDNWLLILDGIHFDLVGLQHYIPFTRNTGIIYTSTERTTGEEYQFDNPQVIALDALTKQEAQELLFEEMGKRQPYTQDDLRRAEELVELMDRLPLMIHVAALQLKATREPLAKYLRSFRSRPKVGNLLAYRAVREQLEHRGATAALNLMSLLSFFGTHIPVEMIVLGAKALDKRTPVKTADPETQRSSLNNTFKILIAFALVERNESTEASSASSHSTRSVDMGQDSLDILRVHGIVQAFFIDALAEEKQAPFWLERAICIFCKAFDVSDRRAADDPQTGVPEDFRRLRIHGERLLAHISRFEKRHPDLTQCREFVESRLSTIDKRIDELTKRITDASSQGSEPIVVSVFERTNSLSEEDSLTPPSNNSIVEPYILYDENSPLSPLESPAIYSATDYNPYHWHVTYPHGVPYDDVDYSRTVTPQPVPTEVFESMSMPDDDEVTRKVFGPHHRTIKRHAERRYRDHAGSWRAASQILSDPRVSISRETAKGIINATTIQQMSRPRSSTDSISSDATKAQLTLDRINRGSPSLQQRSTEDNIESVSDTTSVARPRLIAGKPSYADAKAEAAVDDDYPVSVTFSSPAPSPNNAATSILKRRENDRSVSLDGLAPVKISSPLAATPLTITSPPVPSPLVTQTTSLPEGDKTTRVPKPSSRPPSRPPSTSPSHSPSLRASRPSSVVLSRSTRSSPSHPTGPFPPPPIPIEVNSSSSLRSPPAPNFRQWDSSTRLPQRSIVEHDEYPPLSQSFPSIRTPPSLPYPHTVHNPPEGFPASEHPPPWVASAMSPNLHPQGYSSQPMSRDPSHQSSHSHGSSNSLNHTTSPLAHSSSLESQVMQRPRSRRPSVVETEPSPRLDGLELEPVITSYSLYSESTRGRKRTATGGLSHSSNSPSLLSRFKPKRRGSDSRRHRSASGRLSSLTRISRISLSPDLDSPKDAEPMSRSGSGGIRLADGRVVEFGSPQQGGEASSTPVTSSARAKAGNGNGNSPPISSSPSRTLSRFSPHRLSRRGRKGNLKETATTSDVGLGILQQQRQSP